MHVRPSKARPDPRRNLVGFSVGSVRYAISVENVKQIINPLPVTPLPHMPPSIAGVAEHRGVVLPVVDLRVHYGVPSADTKKTKWILIEIAGRVVGLIVDGVAGVFGAGTEAMRPAPLLGQGDARRGLSGVVSYEGAMVFVVDQALVEELAHTAIAGGLPKAADGRAPAGRGK